MSINIQQNYYEDTEHFVKKILSDFFDVLNRCQFLIKKKHHNGVNFCMMSHQQYFDSTINNQSDNMNKYNFDNVLNIHGYIFERKKSQRCVNVWSSARYK